MCLTLSTFSGEYQREILRNITKSELFSKMLAGKLDVASLEKSALAQHESEDVYKVSSVDYSSNILNVVPLMIPPSGTGKEEKISYFASTPIAYDFAERKGEEGEPPRTRVEAAGNFFSTYKIAKGCAVVIKSTKGSAKKIYFLGPDCLKK